MKISSQNYFQEIWQQISENKYENKDKRLGITVSIVRHFMTTKCDILNW